MSKVRVLIVDEVVTVRRILADVLADDPLLEVVGTAATARIALAKIAQLSPDLVILDPHMGGVIGEPFVNTLRNAYPTLAVLPFSKAEVQRSDSGLNLRAMAATPDDVHTRTADWIQEQLLPQIRHWVAQKDRAGRPVPSETPFVLRKDGGSRSSLPSRPKIEIVAIGASTGGPNALTTLLSAFAATCPVPIVIVQHMPPYFTGLLARRLSVEASLAAHEGVAGSILTPGQVWLAPGDHHMMVAREGGLPRLRMHQGPPENSCRPAVDVLFRSVAEMYGPTVLAVVLTGMGQDGLHGCKAVREAGGQVLVQDAATSVVWGMPGVVDRAGLADQVLPLEMLGPEIQRRLARGRSVPAT